MSTDVYTEAPAPTVESVVAKMLVFIDELSDHPLFPYQQALAARIIESMIINDGEEITALFSRQSGKSETLADTVAGCMVLFPLLAKVFPTLMGKFKDGLWVGTFAPITDQAENLFSRIVQRLTSEKAEEMLSDPDIQDAVKTGDRIVKLPRLGSLCRMQTAHPKAKIEGRTYHLIVMDESQDCDDKVVNKSIRPMGAFTNATIVKVGTPSIRKNHFYKSIQYNRRRQTARKRIDNHFQADWKQCAKHNPNYSRFVRKEMQRLGEDSDEFQLSYALRWLLDRGMFTTQYMMDELGDTTMSIVPHYFLTPVVVGVDPARKLDSTVVTVVQVDWDRPDEFGFFNHRVLSWMEMHGDDWEQQYFRIQKYLSDFKVLAVGVDSQGVGDAVAQRLGVMLGAKGVEVKHLPSDRKHQSERWTHLMQLMQRGKVTWPASTRTKRTRAFKRFYQQMVDLEKKYEGPYLLAAAPQEADAHDDYCDSLALATSLTTDMTMPEVEQSGAPW